MLITNAAILIDTEIKHVSNNFVLVLLLDDLPLTESYMATENMLKGRAISKHDLGHFFVKCLSTSEWDGKTVGVWGEYK